MSNHHCTTLLFQNFIVCKLTWIEGDKSSNDPTYTMRKRKRMQAGRDKDEETYKKKRGRAAPFILENTVSGAPECLALNLKAVLFNCEALGLDFGSQIEEQSHEIVVRLLYDFVLQFVHIYLVTLKLNKCRHYVRFACFLK